MPQISNNINLNPNPRITQSSELYTMLVEMRIVNNFKDVSFASEILKFLYPDGYGGWSDPVSSLRQWGDDRGLNTEHLTYWGTPIQEEWSRASKNQKAITKLPAWKQSLHDSQEQEGGLVESYNPTKEMTIEEMFKDLRLDGARDMWGVVVNGEVVRSDQEIITPEDDVKILPHFAGAAPIAIRELISNLELRILLSLENRQKKICSFLTDVQIEQIIEFWKESEGRIYRKGDLDSENRNSAHFALFRYVLLNKLSDDNIISGSDYNDLYKITGDFGPILSNIRADPSEDRFQFAPGENVLALIHTKVKVALNEKFTGQILKNRLLEYKELFDLQYKIYGYNIENPFYILALETFYGWADVLANEEFNLISGNSLAKLSNFYGSSEKFSRLLGRLRSHCTSHPERLGNIENYIKTIRDKINDGINDQTFDLSEDTKTRLFERIELLSSAYLDKTNSYYENRMILGKLLPEDSDFQNAKLEIVARIADILDIENINVKDFSEFLFNDRDYLNKYFTATYQADHRPDYFTLEWIKSNIRTSSIFDISKFTREAMNLEIDKWMSENPFSTLYLSEKSRFHVLKYGNDFQIKEFRVFESICKILYLKTGDPRFTKQSIKDVFGIEADLTTSLRKNDLILVFSDILNILVKSKEFQSLEGDVSKRKAYVRQIRNIEQYIIYREKSEQAYYSQKYKSWPLQDLRKLFERDDYIMAFDVMMMLSRDLATEPVFFDDLDKSIFEETNQKDESFARQHIDPKKFWSLYVSRMFLTTRTYHGTYPDILNRGAGKISVFDQQVCAEGIKLLIDLGLKKKGSGPDRLISEVDIREVFTKLGRGSLYTMSDGRTVLDWWKQGSPTGLRQDKPFELRLKYFNEKIKFRRDNSDQLFLQQFQGTAYDRFWKAALEEANNYYILSRIKNSRDLSKFLSIPDSDLMRRIFPEIVTTLIKYI